MKSWGLWLIVGSVLSISHLIFWGRLDLTSTVTVVELEWTLTALIGSGYSGWFLVASFGDYRWLQGTGRDGSSRNAAEILILLAAVLLGVHLLFLVIGALSMLTPTVRTTPAGVVAGVGFTWWGQLLVVLLARVQVLRNRLALAPPNK